MTPQGPRIFTVNPQTFGAGRSALSQASPFKRLVIVLVLMLIAIPLLALGMVMLLVVFVVGMFRALFQSAGRTPTPTAGQPGPTEPRPGASSPRKSHRDDSMRENVKVIER